MREVLAAYADISDHASWVASSVGIGTVWKWSYTHSESHAVPSAYAARFTHHRPMLFRWGCLSNRVANPEE
jgi:hypothetical protein